MPAWATPVLSAAFAASSPESADPAPLLTWDAPPGCPSQDEVLALLGRVLPQGTAAGSLRARARVVARDDRFVIELELESSSGQSARRLEDSGCGTLAAAAVFVVAVAIDPVAVARVTVLDSPAGDAPDSRPPRPEPGSLARADLDVRPGAGIGGERLLAPEADHSRESPADPRPSLDTAVSRPARRRRSHGVGGSARPVVAVGIGSVPELDVGVGLIGAAAGEHWRAELGFLHVLARSARLSRLPDAGAEVGLWTGLARGCGVLTPRRWLELPLCAHVELGGMRARGVGVVDAGVARAPWFAAGAAAAVAVLPAARVALWAELHGYGTPVRPRFVVKGEDASLYSTPGGGVRGSLGLEVRFP